MENISHPIHRGNPSKINNLKLARKPNNKQVYNLKCFLSLRFVLFVSTQEQYKFCYEVALEALSSFWLAAGWNSLFWFAIDAACPFQRNTGTHKMRHCFVLTRAQPVSMCACGCVWECVHGGMLVHLCACNNTHPHKPVQTRGGETDIHTGDFHGCVFTSARLGTTCLYREKKKKKWYVIKADVKKKKHHFFLLYLSVLSAGLWCDYCTVFPF